METPELFYPEIMVQIGDYTFNRGIAIEVSSSKQSYFDWAKVRFTEQFEPEIALNKKDLAQIYLGYSGILEPVFLGYVCQPYSGASTGEILLKDEMLCLEETKVSGVFVDTTPQELLAYFLNKAGVSKFKLSSQIYPAKKQVVFSQMSVIEAIEEIHTAWNIHPLFFFSGGTFYCGVQPAQDKTYQFEYGVNILSCTRSGGEWVLETVSAPFIHHSQIISVIHPQVSGRFEVSKVRFITNDAGFIRTYIYF